jgi:hypothetical protein
MARHRLALWLMWHADSCGRWEPVVGDLLEEIADGRRSRWWVWQQLVGFCAVALFANVRDELRVTPRLVATFLAIVFLGGASLTSVGAVVETWLTCYLVAGTISLFGHIMSRAAGGGNQLTSADSR